MGDSQYCEKINNFSKQSRDDDSEAGKRLFYALFAIFSFCLLLTIAAMITLLLNKSVKQKPQFALLYIFAILTILGKVQSIYLILD